MDPVDILKHLIEFPTYQVSQDKVEEGMKNCSSFLSENLEKFGFKTFTWQAITITNHKDKPVFLFVHLMGGCTYPLQETGFAGEA